MRVRVQVRGTDPLGGQQARAVSIAPIQNLTGSAIIATYRNPTGGVTLDRAFRIFDRTLDAMTGSIYTDTPQPMALNRQSFDELHFRDTPTIPMALRVQLPSHGTLSLESVRGQCSFVVWVVAVVDTYRFILERFRWQVQWDIRIVDDTIENRSSLESAGTVTEPAEPLVSGPLANDAYGDLQPTDRLWAI